MSCVHKFAFLVAVAMLSSCRMPVLGPVEAVITIDTSKRYQTIVGWEATAQAGYEFVSFPHYGDKLMADAVNDLGINRVRIEAQSGAENISDYWAQASSGAVPHSQYLQKRNEIVNDNDDPFEINWSGFHFSELDRMIEVVVIPMKRSLAERGEDLLVNLNYVDFGSSDFEHKVDPEEYAEFVLAVFLHMQEKYGFVPDTLELSLEPDTKAAGWTAEQMARAAVATASRLRANSFNPGFVGPSTTNASVALKYIDEIARYPGAMETIVEFSYHRYAGVNDEVLKELAERAARYNKRTSMLEWIGADHNTLHSDLKLANVSAWQQYTLAYSGEDDGAAYYKIDSEESADASVSLGKRTKLLRQYFRFIRPGAVRVEASSTNEHLDPVAFVNPGRRCVVVVNAKAWGTFSIAALPAGRYVVTKARTDGEDAGEAEYIEHSGVGLFSVRVPAPGVVTVSIAD